MNLTGRTFAILGIVALHAVSAGATTIVLPSDVELVDRSPLVLTATVVSSSPVDVDGAIWTETLLAVEETLKGRASARITVREPGGRLGDRVTVIWGAPSYAPGDRVLAFLAPRADGTWQTVDLIAGKFRERVIGGRPFWERRLDGEGLSVLAAGARTAGASAPLRDHELMRALVRDRAAGRSVSSAVASPPSGSVTPHFALISDPQVYRWNFDAGKSEWKSVGSQDGYEGGGVPDLRTGMQAWASYPAARISYVYGGVSTAPPGGLASANGVNEVLFGDPKQEIPGSWTGTSGVVGVGGFNAVSGPEPWTSPFSADAAHPAGTFSAYTILEGNLVIQDGVAPSLGIPSTELAEILAHEFGHTLGFGHSTDPTALMYASLQSLGAFLRSDDQVAARWLYPASGGEPPPPPLELPLAPTELRLTLLQETLVQIAWQDNATNETTQTIYYQPDGEPARKYRDVGPNVTAANLTSLVPGRGYRVWLTARNTSGESAPSNAVAFTVPLPPLESSFSVSPSTGTAGITTFAFFDQSKGGAVSRAWSFGNGSTSTAANPTHVYQQAGTWTVTLVVTNAQGQQSQSAKTIVVAPAPVLIADFRIEPAAPIAGETVTFLDESIGSAISWSWNFGDGTTSTLRNPTHRFSTPGTYSIQLTIDNGLQVDATSQVIVVAAGSGGSPAFAADFSMSQSTPLVHEQVSFTDRSSEAAIAWTWTFGDGATSTLRNPTHRYSRPGTYPVTLVARSATASSTRVRSIVVREGAEPFRAVLPVSAETQGAGGTSWRTELAMHNGGREPADVILTLLRAAGQPPIVRRAELMPGESRTWNRVLAELFGLSSGAGAILVESTSHTETPRIRVASRTFTGDHGTYGQSVQAMIVKPANGGAAPTQYLTGLEASSSYRTNIGWVNLADSPVKATLQLRDLLGSNLGQATVTIEARSFDQRPLAHWFPFLEKQERGGMIVALSADRQQAVFAYASVVDQRSQDPVYVAAMPAPAGDRLILPGVGRTRGAGSTFWRSDLSLFNPGSTQMALRFRLLPAAQDNRSVPWKTAEILPGRGLALPDVASWLGASEFAGGLEISWTGSVSPIPGSRTYTTREIDGGTFGQSIPAIAPVRAGTSSIVTGLRSGSGFRSNLGLTNGGDDPIAVEIAILRADGSVAGEGLVVLPPRSSMQQPVGAMFPSIDPATLGAFTFRARSLDYATLFAWGSVIDDLSGDPVFLAGD